MYINWGGFPFRGKYTYAHSANIKKELHSAMNPSENRASVSLSPHLFN